MKNTITLIKELKLVESKKSFELLLKNYLDDGYSVKNLLENIKDKDKRKIILEMVFYRSLYSSQKMIKDYFEYIDNEEKIYVFRIILKRSPLQAYDFYKEIENPFSNLTDDEISKVIDQLATEVIIKDFDACYVNLIFSKKLINRKDYYKLLEIKEHLSCDVRKSIYKKSFLKESKKDFLRVIEYLNEEEKKEYSNLFALDHSSNNYELATYILNNKLYKEENLNKLIDIIGNNAPACVIYDTLMSDNLNVQSINKLEAYLLKTRDIEYISYYYFYKNKKAFIALFGSALLFLSFVKLNESKFKNTKILNNVISKIKDENVIYTDNVMNKLDSSYQKQK